MTASAKSMLFFGIYLGLLGLSLILAPGPLLELIGLPMPQDVWVHVFGMLAFLLAIYYVVAALQNVVAFFRWTVVVRPLVVVFLSGFVLAGWARPSLIVPGLVDLVCAVWTGLLLRAEDRRAAAG